MLLRGKLPSAQRGSKGEPAGEGLMARGLRQRRWGMKRMYEEHLPWNPLKTFVVLRIEPRVPVLGTRSATRLDYHTGHLELRRAGCPGVTV